MSKQRLYRVGSVSTEDNSSPGIVDVNERWLSERDMIDHLISCRNLATVKVFVADVKMVHVCENCGHTMEEA